MKTIEPSFEAIRKVNKTSFILLIVTSIHYFHRAEIKLLTTTLLKDKCSIAPAIRIFIRTRKTKIFTG